MDKEFEDYWNLHQRHLILSAPEKLRSEYMEAGRLDSPADWVCFILPVGVGILLQPLLRFTSEILYMGNSFSRRCCIVCSHANDKAIYIQEKDRG